MMIFAKIMSFYFLLASLGLVDSNCFARVHDYQTVRMKSTGGAGVGSLLLNETAIFNPAPIAFFKESSIYLDKSDFRPRTDTDSSIGRNTSNDNDTYGVIVADGSRDFAGALSYQQQEEFPFSRKRFSAGFGHKVKDSSSVGFGYRYTHDYSSADPEGTNKHQLIAGASHVLSDNLTMGVLYDDPTAMVKEDSRGYFGLQWFIQSYFAIVGDLGGDFRRGLSETLVYRGAFQFSVLDDFYIRAGIFDDYALGEKGNGIGASWVGPKLEIDLALKSSKPNGKSPKTGVIPSDFTDTSFALSYRF